MPYLTQADLAELAGVSEALVAQVENGRYENLNASVVIKLSTALDLAPNQEQYLLNFLQAQSCSRDPKPQDIPAMLRAVVRSSLPSPAMILTPRLDVVHWNTTAARMLGDFSAMPTAHRNIVLQMFLEPTMRERWVNWADNARNMLAALRMFMSQNPVYRDDIALLAASVSERDRQFREWWNSEDPVLTPNREKDFRHPDVGMLHIYQTVGAVLGSPHHSILLMTPRDEATEAAFRMMAG